MHLAIFLPDADEPEQLIPSAELCDSSLTISYSVAVIWCEVEEWQLNAWRCYSHHVQEWAILPKCNMYMPKLPVRRLGTIRIVSTPYMSMELS